MKWFAQLCSSSPFFQAIVKQLQKTLQQQRVVQNQRLKSLKTLQDQYLKGINDLTRIHREQQLNINAELRKDLSNLQKKMMDDAVLFCSFPSFHIPSRFPFTDHDRLPCFYFVLAKISRIFIENKKIHCFSSPFRARKFDIFLE